jgi:uncharacterized protein (DUF1684 family)
LTIVGKKGAAMTDLNKFRKSKNAFLRHDECSPLTEEQKRFFKGLTYYPLNPALRMTVKVEEFEVKEEISMHTSKGRNQSYTRFGRFSFDVNGKKAELTIYEVDDEYFLPFTDASAGVETYKGGRYLEPIRKEGGKFLVDFNYSYNPYCAYNNRWSCPLPPVENCIQVPIQAGEMIFYHE